MTIDPRAVVDKDAQVDPSATIGPYTVVGAGVTIGANTELQPHCMVEGLTTIGANCFVGAFSTLGGAPQDISYAGEQTELVIGDNNKIREYVSIHRGSPGGGGKTVIGNNNMIMGYSHIAHDCKIGNHSVLANLAILAGHVEIGNRVFLSANVGLHQFCRVGDFAFLGGMSGYGRDIPPYVMVSGFRSSVRISGLNKIGLKRNGFDRETISRIDRVFRIIYHSSDLLFKDALSQAKEDAADCPEAEYMVSFFENSKRGVVTSAKE